jgi:hypothetical protein
MSQPQLLIAEHSSGKMIDITDADNGLNCDCTCACCGEALIARQGEVNAWCFAHQSGSNCAGAIESALHKAAKQILIDYRQLYIGELNILSTYLSDALKRETYGLDDSPLIHHYNRLQSFILSHHHEVLKLNDVVTEQRIDGEAIIPDATCITANGNQFYVEFVVSHACDENKIKMFKQINAPVIEIYLDSLCSHSFTMEDVKKAITGIGEQSLSILREWLVKPKYMLQAEGMVADLYRDIGNVQEARLTAERLANEARAKARVEALAIEAAKRTDIEILGVTMTIREKDWGCNIWMPHIASDEKFKKIANLLSRVGAKRHHDHWNLNGKNAKTRLVAAIENKKQEIKLEEAETNKLKIEKRKQAAIEAQVRAEHHAEMIRVRKAEEEEKERVATIEESIKQKQRDDEARRIKANRDVFLSSLREKYLDVKDFRYKYFVINEELKNAGFQILSPADNI